MIFAVINQKGGAGKTTLSVHLAGYLRGLGHSVAFIDNDPQASASRWVSAALPDVTLAAITDANTLVEQLQELDRTHDYVVCDGSPRLNEQTHVLMYFAAKILIPVLPSALDVHATLETKTAIDRVAEARAADGLSEPAATIVLNKVRAISEQGKLVRKVLRDMGLPIADTKLGLRDAYAKAVVDDSVVTKPQTGKRINKGQQQAAAELIQLFKEVLPHEHDNDSRQAA